MITIVPKNKMPGINLTKRWKTCTLKTLRHWKKLKKTWRNGKICHGLFPQYLKQSTVNSNSYQNPNDIFTEIEQKNPKTCLESQKTPNRQSNPKKKEKKKKNWRYHTPWFQIILQSSNSQNSMILVEKKRHRDQCNRIENSEVNGDIIYNKEAKNIP